MQRIMLLLYEFSRGNQVDGSLRVAIRKLGREYFNLNDTLHFSY